MHIPVYQPFLEGNYKKYTQEAIDSTWISSRGPYIELFETAFSKFLGQDTFSTTVSNGTVALDLALRVLNIGPGDEVILPSFTYVATANAVVRSGAIPIFVDSENLTWNMNPSEVESSISAKTKAVLAVHIYGSACNIKAIKRLTDSHGIALIEDCAEAIGTSVDDRMAGTFGDVSTFSFFGNKTITTGEGGMVCSRDQKIIDLARHLKSQAVSKTREYWHDDIGYNFRMTNIQAAIGLSQIELVHEILKKKQNVHESYRTLLSSPLINFQSNLPNSYNSRWMVACQLNSAKLTDKVRTVLRENSIETRPTFPVVTDFEMYKKYKCKLPVAKSISSNGLCLPSFPQLSNLQISKISEIIMSEVNNFNGK